MLYAKVVLGLPVEGPFDYSVPGEFQKQIAPGCRIWVDWRKQKKIAYVVDLSRKTSINKVKPITSLIDTVAILDKNMLFLTRQLSQYYCCSWGEAIETALPEGLRKGKVFADAADSDIKTKGVSLVSTSAEDNLLVHDLTGLKRWDIYISRIKEVVNQGRSVIMLLPDKNAVLKAKEIINTRINVRLSVLDRKDPKELEE